MLEKEIIEWYESGQLISDQAAGEIASWYQSPGPDGIEFAYFASSIQAGKWYVPQEFCDVLRNKIAAVPLSDKFPLMAMLAHVTNRAYDGDQMQETYIAWLDSQIYSTDM